MRPAVRVVGVTKGFRRPLDRSTTLKYRATHPHTSSRYETFLALRDISFDVPRGEFLGIIGPNGCGKSTLLKILSRIYRPDAGHVEVNGKVSPFLELGVGFNPELTARENVFLNGAVLGLTRSALKERVDGIIAFAELSDFSDMKLKNFSSGMQVRLAFSVAIQAEADILLMDEVLAVGDANFVAKCFEVFSRYKREGKTVVLVTHDLGSVNLYCDRALHIDHGRLVSDGHPREVTAEYMRMVGAESDADAPPVDTGEGTHRRGSRELEITGTRFLDGSGSPHSSFLTGQPMTIEVTIAARRDVGEFNCGISIERSDGVGLALPNCALDGGLISSPKAGQVARLRYEIKSLPLLPASYLATVLISDASASRFFDVIERGASFRVVDERGRSGLVDLGGRWTLQGVHLTRAWHTGGAGAASARGRQPSPRRTSPMTKS